MDQPAKRVYTFGDFRLDHASNLLIHKGQPIPLTPKVFDTLLLLVENSGRLVDKDQFMRRLWPDTFVGDDALAQNIHILRKVLEETANGQEYIATIPKRGYRFVADVHAGPQDGEDWVIASRSRSQVVIEKTEGAPAEALQALPASLPRKVNWKYLLPIGVLIGGLVAGLAMTGRFFFSRKAHRLADKDTIVLADFTNTTGDTVFDGTLRQGLSIQLEQSPFLSIVSDQQVQQTLQMMGQEPDAKLTPDIARELCQRTGSAAVIDGSITQIGTPYLLTVRAVNCTSGETLASTEAQASDKSHVLDALGKTASEIRNKLGESLSMVQKLDTPLAQATTSSLEALKAYSAGRRSQSNAAAIPFYKRAIELDTNFASAYVGLGVSYTNLGETALGSENLQKAYERSDQVSEREKFTISGNYYTTATGDLQKANQTFQLWARTYPRDNAPHDQLAFNYSSVGQYEEAVVEALEALRANPDSSASYIALIAEYAALNRLDEAKVAYQQALAHNLESDPLLHVNLYGVAFLQGDATEMHRQVAWTTGKLSAEDVLLSMQSDTEAFSGHLQRARDFSRLAVVSAKGAEEKEVAAEWQLNGALRDAEFGNLAQARNETASALALVSTRDVQVLASLVLARVQDSARAQKMADELEKQNPLNTVIIGYWLPTIRTAIEIGRNNATKAVELARAAIPYELGEPNPQAEFGAFLYPAYVRGHAYLLLHQGKQAVAEFQKFLDHRGLVANCFLAPLAHLQLGRAYAMQGDTAKARAAYQDFLTLWKDADPDIPVLKQAKAEYAKLL